MTTEQKEEGAAGVGVPAKAHVWSLVFDYPGEEKQVVGVTDRDDLIAKLREDVSDAGEPNMIEGIADQLLREGVWHDEGGCIRLFAHGVGVDAKAQDVPFPKLPQPDVYLGRVGYFDSQTMHDYAMAYSRAVQRAAGVAIPDGGQQ